jgi:hypothetical protein
MEKSSKDLTVKLLKEWAAAKADPDAPVVFSGRSYSANDYVTEVEQETPFGKEFLDYMEASAKRANTPLDEFITDSFERMIKAEPGPGAKKRGGPSV